VTKDETVEVDAAATVQPPPRVSFWSVIRSETGFRRVLIAQALSVHGDQIAAIALTFAILRSGGPVDLGIVLAAKIAALSVSSVVGGALADRHSPRTVMLAANASCCLSQSLTALTLGTGHAGLALLLPLQVASSAGTGAFRPAATALTPSIVADTHLLRANALLGITSNIAMTAGPALGAALMAAVGARTALAVDAATFCVGALLIGGVRAASRSTVTSRPSFRTSIGEGWSEVRHRRPILTMITFFAAYQLFVTSTLGAAGPARAAVIGGPGIWSAVLGAMGIGMVLGGVLAPRLTTTRPLRTAVLLSSGIGAAFPVLALTHQLILIAVTFALSGVALELGNVLWFTTLQTSVPRERLARVSSLDWFTSTSLRPLGLTVNGLVVSAAGPGVPLCIAAILLVPLALTALRYLGQEQYS
jgi:MFS family permease